MPQPQWKPPAKQGMVTFTNLGPGSQTLPFSIQSPGNVALVYVEQVDYTNPTALYFTCGSWTSNTFGGFPTKGQQQEGLFLLQYQPSVPGPVQTLQLVVATSNGGPTSSGGAGISLVQVSPGFDGIGPNTLGEPDANDTPGVRQLKYQQFLSLYGAKDPGLGR